MLQQYDPSAEVPDFSPAQLETLSRSIEQKKQRLEDDINNYIRRKQDELRKYLLDECRSMERAASTRETATKASTVDPASSANLSPNVDLSSPRPTDSTADLTRLVLGDTAKRTKHTRVHKREKELCGLVTPIFLPLLDATTVPTKKTKEKRRLADDEGADAPTQLEPGSPSRDAHQGKEIRRPRSTNREDSMERAEGSVTGGGPKEGQKPEILKKRRAAVKKSSLRHVNTPRTRRKRVSLVIDDQIVLPADNIAEGPLVPPSHTTASTDSNSNSIGSLEDSIDPRLVFPYSPPTQPEDQDPVHHNVALPILLPSTLSITHPSHDISESPPALEYEPPQTVTPSRTEDSIPQHASKNPIYANQPDIAEAEEEDFNTYVGGIDGSGVDNVDQAGSYGYPSSLGASYLESYMKSRPLSVRVASADKAGLPEEEKRALVNGDNNPKQDMDLDFGNADDTDDMDIMGDMEGF